MKKVALFIIFTAILVFVGVGFGEEKHGSQTEKKYPPYPDIWQWEFLKEKHTAVSNAIVKLPDGDYVIVKRKFTATKGISKDSIPIGCYLLFSNQKLSTDECEKFHYCLIYNKSCDFFKQINANVVEPATFPNDSPIYTGDIMITHKSVGINSPKCSIGYTAIILKHVKDNKIISSFVPIYISDKPIKVYINYDCEWNWGSNHGKDYILTPIVVNLPVDIYPLEKGNFLIRITLSNIVYFMRFTSEMESKSSLVGRKFFFISEDEFKKLMFKKEINGELVPYSDYEVYKNVSNYIKSKNNRR